MALTKKDKQEIYTIVAQAIEALILPIMATKEDLKNYVTKEEFNEKIAEIKKTTDELKQTTNELKQTTDELKQTTDELKQTTDELTIMVHERFEELVSMLGVYTGDKVTQKEHQQLIKRMERVEDLVLSR